MREENLNILHRFNNHNKEVRIGPYFVGGFCIETNTVYEYNGCIFHKCPFDCFVSEKVRRQKWYKDTMKQVEIKDNNKYEFLKSEGYSVVVVMQECVF